MVQLLVISSDPANISGLTSEFAGNREAPVQHAASGREALERVGSQPFDLVVVDEALSDMTGLSFARQLVKCNPMIHCAVVSSLSEEAFHEASEGLGLLAKLPPRPSAEDGRYLLERYNMVTGRLSS